MSIAQKEIVIVGAGPGGMMLAWLLVKNGVTVKLIERHTDFSREFRGEGIQISVVKHLEDLGLMKDINRLGMSARAEAARVFFDNKPVAVLKGVDGVSDFGIILHQEKFLAYLHAELSKSPLYESYMGWNAMSFEQGNEQITGVNVRDNSHNKQTITGDVFCITTGRGTPLRKRLNLKVKKVATHWNILWLLLPRPSNEALIPQGFRAYLNGESIFILYTNAEGLIQMAWGKKDQKVLMEKDFEKRKDVLLSEIPEQYKELVQKGYNENTKSQFLKVECDRLDRWHYKNVLFLGDAAHTMSPVAGQGINLAIRDSLVAANHLIPELKKENTHYTELFDKIQKERIKEIRIMQKFQQKFGYFMLGAPRWQSKFFFFVMLPILGRIGIRKRMLKMVQSGVSEVVFKHKA